jgi:hypothetical protein
MSPIPTPSDSLTPRHHGARIRMARDDEPPPQPADRLERRLDDAAADLCVLQPHPFSGPLIVFRRESGWMLPAT